MKVVLLAGGYGSRISEESVLKPKPMIEIGNFPMLWHIMKGYAAAGFDDFIVCLGYKGYYIKEYFDHYFLHEADVTFDFRNNTREYHKHHAEPWRVTLVNTGQETMTGGRVKRIREYVGNETFMLTYGDGLSNVDIKALLSYHRSHGKMVTVTAAQPSGRFGALDVNADGRVKSFIEKPKGDGAWVNAGFFVMEPGIFDYIDGDSTPLEKEPLAKVASEGQLMSFFHRGFWQPMDTMRDKNHLEELWNGGNAPWVTW